MMASSPTADKRQESSEEEEEDYMSEDFLKQCTSNDVRPSLLHSRADKRKHDIIKRQYEANQTKVEREKARLKSLEDGLKLPIGEDNKGFKMLQKMGFKPGSSLGKETNNPERKGITAPIEIELKQGRGGLGKEQHDMEKHQQTFGNPEEYRIRRQNAVLAREVVLDLKKAVFACHSLDVESGKTEPLEKWYWPKLKPKKRKDLDDTVDSEDEDESPLPSKRQRTVEGDDEEESQGSSDDDDDALDIPNEEKLNAIKDYLRSQYFYCIWCATKFENESDMQDSCPGSTKDDH